ncbi:MAG: archaemetzincin family Zn-dependent metalloprotease [Desulfobacteraceae bacterium]|nr:archaemetzincin family Zn-dependent metalloprotease [Desulfobacteraceae bacterium]
MIVPPPHSIAISPVGASDTELLIQVGKEISRIFGYQTEIIPLLKDVDFALDPSRNQYHSTLILGELASLAPHAIKVVAIVQVDLFIPILTHIFGEAQLGGKACIISIYRLREGLSSLSNPEFYHKRVVKEAIHELGHTFRLRHCRDQSCIMHYCRTVKDVDRRSDQFCRYCKVLLEDEMKRLNRNWGSRNPAI